ncbi:MAG: hypothetical protein U9R50_10600 [Campylobacterota bacterium]|nr:hypothetical protein [Campylobacterota bacterium]
MKNLFLILMLPSLLLAQSINLNQLLEHAQKEYPSFKAAQEEIHAKHLEHEAEFSTSPLTLFTTLANATPAIGKDNIEYSVGVEKEFRFGNSAYHTSQMGHFEHKAMEVMADRDLLILQNEFKVQYHLSCLEKETVSNSKKLYEQLTRVYSNKKERL